MGFERGWRLEESSPYEEARRLDSRFRGNDRRALRTPRLGGGGRISYEISQSCHKRSLSTSPPVSPSPRLHRGVTGEGEDIERGVCTPLKRPVGQWEYKLRDKP